MLKKTSVLVIIAMLLPHLVFAEDKIKYVLKGTLVPFNGFLVPEAYYKEALKQHVDFGSCQMELEYTKSSFKEQLVEMERKANLQIQQEKEISQSMKSECIKQIDKASTIPVYKRPWFVAVSVAAIMLGIFSLSK